MRLVNSFLIPSLLLVLLVSGCSPPPQKARPRFFWPPPPQEPKIEYLEFYESADALKRGYYDWFEEVVLGKVTSGGLFSSPNDVASDGAGRIIVSDAGSHKVHVLDKVNRIARQLSHVDGEVFYFARPEGVDIDSEGRSYVVDTASREVLVFGADEKFSYVFGSDVLKRPTGIAVDAARGKVYVADTAVHQIKVFTLNGQLVDTWGKHGDGVSSFNFPLDVDIDQAGHVYVLDSMNARVQVLNSSGEFVRQFGERGTAIGSFQVPKAIAVSPSGLVYVSDTMAKRFVIFNTEGEYLLTIGGYSAFTDGRVRPGGFYFPKGIDADDDETIWIVDTLNHMVHKYQYLSDQYLQSHPIKPEEVFRGR